MGAAIRGGGSRRVGSIWFAGVPPGRRLSERQLRSPEPRSVAGPPATAQPGAASCMRAANRVVVVLVSDDDDDVARPMIVLADDGRRRRLLCRAHTPRRFAGSS